MTPAVCAMDSVRTPASAVPPRCVKAVLMGDTGPAGETFDSIYGAQRLSILRRITDLGPIQVTSRNLEECLPSLADVEVIFSTWGMLKLTEAHLDRLPGLRAVFYAAGSVQYFARPLLRRGITVVNAASANAVPVAEFTLAQILLANKGYFRNTRDFTAPDRYRKAYRGPGNYGVTVALLGAGQIGRALIELLQPFRLPVVVFDPYLTQEEAIILGVEKVSLEEAFRRGQVVSNHLADKPATHHMLTGSLLGLMAPHATFINTGRGGTVVEAELVKVLRDRPDLTALLDVTDPEPPRPDSPLWTLPNVQVSSHIAGSIGDEVKRVADVVMSEFEAWRQGLPLRNAVTERMLETVA